MNRDGERRRETAITGVNEISTETEFAGIMTQRDCNSAIRFFTGLHPTSFFNKNSRDILMVLDLEGTAFWENKKETVRLSGNTSLGTVTNSLALVNLNN